MKMTKDSYLIKGLCRSFKESPLPEHDSKEFWAFFVKKIDKIRDNFGTSEIFNKYDTRDFVVPKLSQLIPVYVEEIPKIVFEVTIRVMYLRSYTDLTTERIQV